MAPKSSKKASSADDDFIFTLSDEEPSAAQLSDEDSEPELAKPTINGTGKKRKREITGNKPDKSTKKAKKSSQAHDATNGRAAEEEGDDDLASDFEFQVAGGGDEALEEFDGWDVKRKDEQGRGAGVDIDEIIARRRGAKEEQSNADSKHEEEEEEVEIDSEGDEFLEEDAFGMGASKEDDSEADEAEASSAEDQEDGEEDSDDSSVAAHVPHPDDLVSESEEEEEKVDAVEAARRKAFFAPEPTTNGKKATQKSALSSFQSMSLSRPILRGLASVGFSTPTPIQLKTIPVALLGKDVVGGAVTGSGKTAAFIIPILERLLYRPKKVPTTRVAILMPTRELAVQCFNVAKKLASYTDITFAQLVGGLSVREQEATLRTRPDIVIATPGRFIDHARNSAGFAIDSLEILVLDEADRMLEDGFADELNEIFAAIPRSRQTMLFSATMTESVDQLVRAGLNKPVRLMVDARRQTVKGLLQEFVRLRPGKEERRLASLLYLCKNVFTERVIIFFRQKKDAHRIRVIFGLCGLKAAELHGSMSQEQRLQALNAFRTGAASFLLATDLASRGLDIKNILTVLNYSAPQTADIYLHRVGRTARAGRPGTACTIAADADRKVIRAAVRAARNTDPDASIKGRTLPNEEVEAWYERLQKIDDEVEEVLMEEKEARVQDVAERELRRGENLVRYEDEIASRPRRTWFATEKEKKEAKEKGRKELNEVGSKASQKLAMEERMDGREVVRKKRKLSGKDRKKLEDGDVRREGRMFKKGKEMRGKGVTKEKGKAKGKAKKGGAKAKAKGKR